MNDPKNTSLLLSFIQEIKDLDNPSYPNPENWSLRDDLLNGVEIGYSISNFSDRELLHKIGQKYGLIPLCPHELIDIEMGPGFKPKYGVVKTSFGNLKILPKKNKPE